MLKYLFIHGLLHLGVLITFGGFANSFYKRNICDFLFTFLHIIPLLKSVFFFIVGPFSEREVNVFNIVNRVAFLESVPIPLKGWPLHVG